MTDANLPEPPLEVAAGGVGEPVTEAFELLGNETRLAIMLALWENIDPFGEGLRDPYEGDAVTFSELQDAVGIRDSGRFTYHLHKLEDYFVEQTREGYKLLEAGERFVRTIVGIAGLDEAAVEPTEIDFRCPECGAPTAVTYGNQKLYHVCTACEGTYALGEKHPKGVLSAWSTNPSALRGRTTEEAFNAIGTQGTLHVMGQLSAGICHWCSGEIDPRLHVCDNHGPETEGGCPACGRQYNPAVRFLCSVCKFRGQTNIPQWSLHHPAVVSFYWNHGIELGYDRFDVEMAEWRWAVNEQVVEEVVSTEPPRMRITFRQEGDAIQLIYDEELNVLEVNEEY